LKRGWLTEGDERGGGGGEDRRPCLKLVKVKKIAMGKKKRNAIAKRKP